MTEREERVVVSTLYGSRLYGTDGPESDYDVKRVVLPSLESLILGRGTATRRSVSGAEEIETTPLRNFLRSASECRIMAIEMLWTPPEFVYEKNTPWDELVDSRRLFVTKNIFNFVSYSARQAAKYGLKGSAIALYKTLLAGTEDSGRLGDYESFFGETAEKYPNLKTELDVSGRKYVSVRGKKYLYGSPAGAVRAAWGKTLAEYGNRAELAANNENVDFKAVSHAFRALYQTEDLLERGELFFPSPRAEYLKKIKRGEISYPELAEILERKIEETKRAVEGSSLPERCVFDEEEFLLRTYGLQKGEVETKL